MHPESDDVLETIAFLDIQKAIAFWKPSLFTIGTHVGIFTFEESNPSLRRVWIMLDFDQTL